jgi:hypothetical protein
MAHPICFFLQEKIKAFVAKKNESVRWLAKQVGVDYTRSFTDFRRANRKVCRSSMPSAF